MREKPGATLLITEARNFYMGRWSGGWWRWRWRWYGGQVGGGGGGGDGLVEDVSVRVVVKVVMVMVYHHKAAGHVRVKLDEGTHENHPSKLHIILESS